MDNDTISRQAAIEVIDAVFPVDPMRSEYAQGIACGAALAKTYVKQLPSVQSEQKTGRWEHDGGHFANRWICSQCGYKFYFEKSEAKYCPNCGAKMESDNNDN